MANIFKLNNLNSVKWTVQITAHLDDIALRSPSFTIQGLECYLMLNADGLLFKLCRKIQLCLIFKTCRKLAPSVDVIVLATSNSRILSSERHSITGGHFITVWTHAESDIPDTLLTFEVIVPVDLPKGELF